MGSEDDLDWEEWDPSRISFVHHMIAGSCAGLAEHISIFPIDTLKTHVQCERCGSTTPLQTWDCAARIVRREGIFRLWRGVSAMFAGCIPAHAAYFSIFESMKIFLGADQHGHRPIEAAGCGATAAFAHDVFMTPFDTVKQRMQLGYYRSMTHCVQSVIAKEGIRAFYLSMPTTLVMNIPYGSIMVAVNESARKLIAPHDQRVSTSTSMIAGGIAGAVAACMTTPFDVIKTRLQTQNLIPCPNRSMLSTTATPCQSIPISFGSMPVVNSMGFKATIEHIYREEGLRGFFRGMGARMVLHTPAVAISWTAYETMKGLLGGLGRR